MGKGLRGPSVRPCGLSRSRLALQPKRLRHDPGQCEKRWDESRTARGAEDTAPRLTQRVLRNVCPANGLRRAQRSLLSVPFHTVQATGESLTHFAVGWASLAQRTLPPMQVFKPMHPSKRWKKNKRLSQVEKPAIAFDEDMGGYYDTGPFDPRGAHPGYAWVETDSSMASYIRELRSIGSAYPKLW